VTAGRGSLVLKAVRGAAWTIATGIGSRALGLAGTLVLTYFVARDELGEVSDAAIAVLLANQFSTIGLGQYYVARPSAGRDVAWHATVAHLAMGLVAVASLLALGRPLAFWMKAPGLGHYLPGLAGAMLLDRFAYMPERVLARDMRFRVIGVCRTAAELAYTTVSVSLAALGWGAMSVVGGNLARSAVRLGAMAASVPRADWLSPTRLSLSTLRAMLRFGVPMSVGNTAGFASRKVDNAIVSGLFGVDVVGAYNLAYNLADVPAVQVGEQIGDVLLPSFSHLAREQDRKAALVRSTGLVALITFPLAVGVGTVAQPLVDALLRPEWHDVGPMLALLSVLSIVRPVGWTISAYLLACNRPRLDAALEILKLVALVALLLTLGREGPLWSCGAVGLAFALHAFGSMWAVQRIDSVTVGALAARCGRPLAACIPMVAAVLGMRAAMVGAGVHAPAMRLVGEIAVGAVVYPLAAWVLAGTMARDLVDLLRRAASERLARQPAS
jgi:PST family polysaccharide transporter